MKKSHKPTALPPARKVSHSSALPEEILQQFLSKSNVIFWAVDRKGKIRVSEGAGLRALKLKPGAFVGENILKRFPRNSEIRKACLRALKGETFTAVLSLNNHFFETEFLPWQNDRHQFQGFFGISINVTESFQSIQEIWRRDKREEVLAQTSRDVVTFFNRKGERIYESPGIERVFGFKPGERASLGRFNQFHPQDRKTARAAFKRAFNNPGVPVRVEVRIRHKDGHWVHGDIILTNFLDVPGVEAVVGQLRDVTDKKKAEDALRLSEQRFRGLIENSQDLITLLDRQGHRIYEAPSIKRILGFEPGERKGVTYDNHPPEEVPKAREAVRQALRKPGKVIRADLKVRRKDGAFIDAEMTLTNLLNDPAVRGIVVNARDVTQRNKVQEELKSRERWFRAMIEKSYDVIGLLGADGSVQYLSPGVVNLTGYTLKERAGRISFDALHPDEREKAQSMYRSLVQKPGASMSERLRFLHKDGHYRVVDVRATNLLHDPDVGGIVVNYRDVTARVEAEETLRQKERHFRALIEHSHDLVYILDREAKRVYESPSVEHILGYRPGERAGTTIFDFLHPDDRERVRGPVRDILGKPGASLVFTARIRHKDGRWVDMEIAGDNLLENPTVQGVVINARDITDRKRAENELRRSEEKFRSLIENSHDVVALVDAVGRSTYISPSYEKILGHRIQDRLGRSFFEIVHPEDQPRIRQSYESLIQTPGATFNGLMRLTNAKGEWRYFEASATNHLENPNMAGIILNFRDVTERLSAEEDLRRSEKNFRMLIEKLPEAVILHMRGIISYVNEALLKLLGYQFQNELIGNHVLDLIHLEDREKVRPRIEGIEPESGFNLPMEQRLLKKDGSTVFVEATGISLLFQGEPVGMGLLRDLTGWRMTEQALRDSEEKFRGLIENAHDVISILTTDGITQYVSLSMVKIMGYTPEERVGRPFLEIVHPHDQAGLAQKLDELKGLKGGTVTAKVRVRHKNGSWRHIEGAGTNLVENPAIRGIVLNYRDVTESVLAEEELRKSEKSFRNLIEKSPDAIMIGNQGMVLYVNPALLRLLGYEMAEEMVGENWDMIIPEPKRAIIRERIKNLNNASSFNPPVELEITRKNGETVPVEGVSFSILFEGQLAWTVLFRDLSERKNAELVLRQSEESFRALIEKSPDGILVHRGDQISYANPAFLRLAGYERVEEVVGQPWNFHLPPEEYQGVRDRINALSDPEAYNPPIERQVKRKDGTVIPVESLSFNIHVNNEKLAVGVIRDLSEKKETERALKRSEESFRNLIERAPDAIMIHTIELTLYVNPAFLKMTGYENPSELVGKSWHLLTPPDVRESIKNRVSQLVDISSANPPVERRILKKNGETVPVEVASFSILFEGKLAVAALFRDLTERKNAEQILIKYTRLGAMGEMAAGLAHEIRNPLSGIGLSAQYLKRKLTESPDAEVQVQNILDQTERLKQLINDTLDFSRDTTSQDLVRVDALDLMQTSLRFVQVQFGPRHSRVQVRWTFEKNAFYLPVNRNRIQQVLVNLMLNAYQAMEKEGILTLGCSEETGKILLRVEDNGPGISPEVRTRLFEPFFTTKQSGSGLGLSVSQRIVEAHGGILRVESLSQGTAFLVELPAFQGQNTGDRP